MNKFQFIELKIEYMIKARKPRHSAMSAWVSCITGEASDKGQVPFFVTKMPMYIPGKEEFTGMNVFEAVKQSVTTRQAAEAYGIRVNRNGMCVCPFHNDRTPSMKVDRRFHCFGCQADGDVIDFTAKLFDVYTAKYERSG